MFLETFPVGCLECNCTVLGCEDSKEAVIIDPGDDEDKILEVVKKKGFQVKYLLHTHAHFDHIGVAGPLKRKGHGKILLHKGDDFLYEALEAQGKMFGFNLPEKDVVDEKIEHRDEIEFGKYHIKIIHTPGHTPGSCTFLLEEKSLLFTGDTLFNRSIGRTDLPGGDFTQIMDSLKNRILTLDENLKIIPGHGPQSILHEEARFNQFLKF